MYQIILAIAKKAGVMNIKELVRKIGFSRQDIIKTLNALSFKGKISYICKAQFDSSNTCTGCSLRNICHLKKGNTNAVPAN
ncbi:MAG: hypothetical protein DRP57_00345 [Spirochaetes bacterium]|nr:MAG: hypothetical protein DRP57_00345 [Spirochaetota bacterium]